jgi:DNA invertase Pin-like site-specific DNA recombinase
MKSSTYSDVSAFFTSKSIEVDGFILFLQTAHTQVMRFFFVYARSVSDWTALLLDSSTRTRTFLLLHNTFGGHMKKVAIYARVSTDKQTCENQLIELRAVAERGGYTIVQEFIDSGISGAKGRADRPALDAMMKAASQRKFDLILVWSIDRLGRSLQNLVELLNDLQSMKVDLMFLQQGMDTSTSSGRMMFSIFGALAEFERNLIRERVIAGQNRAKARGVKMGRPSKMNDGLRSAIQLLRENGDVPPELSSA